MSDPAQTLTFLAWGVFFIVWWLASKGASAATESEPLLSSAAHLGLFALAFTLALFDPFAPLGLAIGQPLVRTGLALTALGIAFAIWARVHLGRNWSGAVTIKKDHVLVRTGPYALVRHPIYTGLLVGFVGTALAAGELRAWIAVALVVVAIGLKVPREERFMEKRFGEAWVQYKARVRGALLPWVL